jgi:hypothetical protein
MEQDPAGSGGKEPRRRAEARAAQAWGSPPGAQPEPRPSGSQPKHRALAVPRSAATLRRAREHVGGRLVTSSIGVGTANPTAPPQPFLHLAAASEAFDGKARDFRQET